MSRKGWLKAVAKTGIEARFPELSIYDDKLDFQDGFRYGAASKRAKVTFQGKEYDIVILYMKPGGNTGKVPQNSRVFRQMPIYHPDLSLEWACSVALDKGKMKVDYRNTSITHRVISNKIDYLLTEEHQHSKLFSTLIRAVEDEETLMKNPEKVGFSYKLGDPHLLFNQEDCTNVVLIRSVKKGTALTDFDKFLIEKTGGIDRYLINTFL